MNVALTGRYLNDIIPLLEERGINIVGIADSPDLIISHGGDGILLGVEREYPGILKLPVRDARSAPTCTAHPHEDLFDLLKSNKLTKSKLMKLEASCNGKKVIGMNDVFFHNVKRVSAVRYRVWLNNELYASEVVGDGAGIATILGATGYYRSITHGTFRTGIGMAFSNSTEVTSHIVLPEDTIIRIQITRGPAILVADNDDDNSIQVNESDEITIKKSESYAYIYGVEQFMCRKCRQLRYIRKHPFEID